MAKPCMKKCCGCCGSLRIGTLVIAILCLVCNLTVFICSCIKLSDPEMGQSTKSLDEEFGLRDFRLFQILDHSWVQILFTLATCISIITSALVTYGVFKRNHKALIPWLSIDAIFTIVCSIIILVAIFFVAEDNEVKTGAVFFMVLIPFGIFIYMWCVVYSYYAVLQEENSRGLYDKQPYRR